MTYKEIIKKAAKQLGMSATEVDEIYKSYWRGVRSHMNSQPLKGELTEEEFNSLRPNIAVIHLGRFGITWDRYKRICELYKATHKNKKKEE